MSENKPWRESVQEKMQDLLDCFQKREAELTRLAEQLEHQRNELENETMKRKRATDQDITEQYRQLDDEKRRFETELKRMADTKEFQSSRIQLDIGGHKYTTSLSTLRKDPDSMLAAMFSGRHQLVNESDGSYFIDRDGTYFRYILNYLRDDFQVDTFPKDEVTLKEIQNEGRYYQLLGLVGAIEELLNPPPPAPDFTQEEINDMIATVSRQTDGQLISPSISPGRHIDFIFHHMTKSADVSGADFRQCRCVQGGPNAFGGQSTSSIQGGGGGVMFGSSCSSFIQLIRMNQVKFLGAKHIGTKFDPTILDVIKF
ncbi:BTB/POZ domain-containing protein KCTD6 [Exaiptasia diaphana]|nr:BTB/POZ domain-containing protein KCTD6 [Exaiptasia diaphana]